MSSLHIILTGASSGIGAALARDLAASGHRLYVCARRVDALATLAASHPGIAAHPCDVSDEEQVIGFIDWVKRRASSVDALVNCAGILPPIGAVDQTESEEWLHTVRVNLFGTYLMTKHAKPLLERSSDARIINFAGGGAFGPFPNYSAYACSKVAVVRLTECLAQELAGAGIRVNALAPGFVATPIHGATLEAGPERAGTEQYDVTVKGVEARVSAAAAIECVRFLLSHAAAGLTGKTISANFDPWREPEFSARISEINQSDLFTLRRVAPWLNAAPSDPGMLEGRGPIERAILEAGAAQSYSAEENQS